VGDEADDDLVFVFLTNSASHGQVRDLARPRDILICVLEDPAYPCAQLDNGHANEFKVIPPPVDLVRTIDADLLYCPFGATTFHTPGVPTIALIADLLHKDYPFTLTAAQIAEREAYIQTTIRVATTLQCISRSGMERMIEHYSVPRTTLFYTYLPIHVRLEKPSQEAAGHSDSISPRPFFFYPANLWLHKNHEVLLLSFARYRHEVGDNAWDLVLTFQDEPRAQYLRGLAETLGIAEHVRFAGFVTDQELHRIWKNAGALVFPSLHEGFGIPLVEAMHYGIPIISGKEFALNEVAGDACYFIDARKPASVAQALAEVSQNGQLRAALIKRGRERLELFDLRVAARSLLDAFRNLTRSAHDFPRKPHYPHDLILTAPTPASAERWNIEMEFRDSASSQKFAVYLGEWPFATFIPATFGDRGFSFFCQPGGRTLGLRVAGMNRLNETGAEADGGNPVSRIIAVDSRKRRILLYETPIHHGPDEG
jgi:glycosyltransferase involved in cell wall biosynthesis